MTGFRLTVAATLTALAVASGGRAQAGFLVAATASGGFGEPASGGTDLALGFTFTGAGQTVVISATGAVDISGLSVGPDGVTLTRAPILGPFPVAYTPLEEKLVDAGTPPPISDPNSIVLNVGGLFAAFVPESLASSPGFLPRDDDLTAVGIPSAALFLVGSGPASFTAPGPGRLYFGINEPFVSNNSGAFDVSVAPVAAVPAPGGLVLFAVGVPGLAAVGRLRRPSRGLTRATKLGG